MKVCKECLDEIKSGGIIIKKGIKLELTTIEKCEAI